MAGWKDLLVALSACVALAGCDRDDAASAKGATAAPAGPSGAPAAVATTRSVITIDGGHDMMARKEATPYTIAPSAELVLEVGEHRFTMRDAGPATPDAMHVAHGSAGYYRGTFSGRRVALNAASLDAMKGGAFPGFEAGESYIVSVGVEGAGADGAMRFTPLWTTTVNVAPR
jgi:hypothetical protein